MSREGRSAGRRVAAAGKGDVYKLLAEGSTRARKMSAVETFKAVRTPLTGFNRSTSIGGAPLSCLWTVHGPSGGGKTSFLVSVMSAFQKVGGIVMFVDVEQAADKGDAESAGWFESLGVDVERVLYVGRTSPKEEVEPLTYEAVRDEIRRTWRRFREMRKEGQIAWGTPLLIVVDSVSKMVPAGYLKKTAKEESGRAGVGREQALLNTEWMLEIGAEIGSDDVIIALIAHEYADQGANAWTSGYKVRGGDAIIFDSMMQIRSTFAGQTYDSTSEGAPAVGKRHRIKVMKNKHGPPFRESCFYTSSGDGVVPMGFDLAREAVHEGLARELLTDGPKLTKLSITLGTKFKWGRRAMTFKQLAADASALAELRDELDSTASKHGGRIVKVDP